MNPTRLLVAAVVLAGLGGLVWWSGKREEAEKEKGNPETPKILSVDESKINQIEIRPASGEATVLKKDASGKWEISAPQTLAADNGVVSALVANVSSLTAERIVDDNPADLKSYGLDPAVVSVSFSGTDGKISTLKLGESTAASSGVYAMVAGDKRLFTIASSTKDGLNKSWKDLRDRHLMTFDQDKISQVELEAAGKAAVAFGRTGQNEWQIVKPRPMRADGFQVEDIVGRLKQVMLDADSDPKQAASAFASAAPAATVKLTMPDGIKTLEIRKSKDDVYARSSMLEGVYKVNRDAADGFNKSVDEFRAKKLFDFGFTDPTRIEYKDGPTDSVWEKAADKWTSKGKNMDSISVQNLIDKLRDLSAAKFVESGFTTPAFELTVVSNEGKRTERVQFAPSGSDFIAKRDNDTSLYQIPGDAIKDLRTAAGGVREEAAPDTKKK
jgi:hypothetical protein